MDVDASILGNHEFNYGLSYLEQAIASYHHPVLSANILTSKGDPYFGQPYVMIEKQGIKVAILGLTTQYIPIGNNLKQLKTYNLYLQLKQRNSMYLNLEN